MKTSLRWTCLIGALVLVVAACGGDEEAPEDTVGHASETTAAPDAEAPQTTEAPDTSDEPDTSESSDMAEEPAPPEEEDSDAPETSEEPAPAARSSPRRGIRCHGAFPDTRGTGTGRPLLPFGDFLFTHY